MKILIVEDEKDIADVLCLVLQYVYTFNIKIYI